MNMTTDHRVRELFSALDALDTAAVMKMFTDNPTLRFGNAEPAVGWDEVEATVSGFLSMIAGLRHDITGVWTGTWPGGEVNSIESHVTYIRKDGSRVGPLPATTTLRFEGDRIKDYQIFIDASPLFA